VAPTVETLPSMISEYVYYFDILLADVFFLYKINLRRIDSDHFLVGYCTRQPNGVQFC